MKRYLTVIFQIIILLIFISGCLDNSTNKEEKIEKSNQVFIEVQFIFLSGSYDTSSFYISIDDEIKYSIRNHTYLGREPDSISMERFNTTKDVIKVEINEILYDISNSTYIDVSKTPNILISLQIPNEIFFDATDGPIILL